MPPTAVPSTRVLLDWTRYLALYGAHVVISLLCLTKKPHETTVEDTKMKSPETTHTVIAHFPARITSDEKSSSQFVYCSCNKQDKYVKMFVFFPIVSAGRTD